MDVTAIVIVAIVFGSVVLLTAIFVSANTASKMLGARGNKLSDEESQLMQELFYGMKKMEERVESLETILLEKGQGE